MEIQGVPQQKCEYKQDIKVQIKKSWGLDKWSLKSQKKRNEPV